MNPRRTILQAMAGALLASCAAYGADAGGTPLLPADSAAIFKLSANAAEYAAMSTASVTGQPFKTALRIQVTRKPQRPAEVTLSAPADAAIAAGDVLLVSFWMRSGDAAEATLDAGFRTVPGAAPAFGAPGAPGVRGGAGAGAPPAGRGAGGRGRGGFGGAPSLNAPAVAGTAWKKVQFPFAVARAYNKGESEVTFTLGLREQTLEIGGIELTDYGTSKKVSELPFTRLGYEGSEPTAAWRKAAEERIEKNRKGDLTVLVTDKSGKPVRGAEVAVHMRKHAFLFGTAVSGASLSNQRFSPEDLAKYKEEITKLFNFAVMENENKWPQWANVASRPATIAALDWLRDSGLKVRGHNLVWPSWNNTNVKAVQDARNDPAALEKVILDHITETTTALRGRFVDWDVINETFTNHDFMDILGRHVMVDWFKAAHAGDPSAKLFINDFNILEGNDQPHQDDYAATIKYLIDEGAPLDGIGLQSHFNARVTPMDELFKRLDRFAAFGKELEITEFDIDTSDEATQADYTRDFMTATFSYPSVKAFIMWGFWEGSHWRPRGAMFRRDWSPKPNFNAYNDLVFKKWWTNASGKTGAKGTFATRGFLGEYDIEAKAGGKTKTIHVTLPKAGAKVECVLE
ncbi:MAG TPA: endo-1,4-beta-xylanase [Candidatus Limnocylindrales bacterium]|nr:endo-1,4-beta-xylanase [Candidatus Limnocylindrales bacterium]